MNETLPRTVALLLALASAACEASRSAYYNTWEKLGYAKRERLVDNVKAARDEQAEAKVQFSTSLEQFKSVVNVQGGDLEAAFDKLNKEYERCRSQAGEVKEKLGSVTLRPSPRSRALELELGGDIEKLIREMEKSIAEADEFIAGMQPRA